MRKLRRLGSRLVIEEVGMGDPRDPKKPDDEKKKKPEDEDEEEEEENGEEAEAKAPA